MDSAVKKSIGAPIKQLSSCVSRVKQADRGRRRKSAPCLSHQAARDSSWVRVYQAELHRERKLRQTKYAQKNAERASMRTYHRGHPPVSRSPNVKTRRAKNEDSMFGAFQSLSLNMAACSPLLNSVQSEGASVLRRGFRWERRK
uniref:Uncharacterized protein n=1 Tax=Denticeps clupeoides TaxID=299321 RepID=A0AAY4DDC5_9TELE